MKSILTTFTVLLFVGLMIINPNTETKGAQDTKEFQGQATYMAKSSIDFGGSLRPMYRSSSIIRSTSSPN